MIGVSSSRSLATALVLGVSLSASPHTLASAGESDGPSGPRASRLVGDVPLPPALRAAFVRAVQTSAAEPWAFERRGDRFVAHEDGAAFVVSASGVDVVTSDVRAHVAAARFGRSDGEPLATPTIAVDHNHATLAR